MFFLLEIVRKYRLQEIALPWWYEHTVLITKKSPLFLKNDFSLKELCILSLGKSEWSFIHSTVLTWGLPCGRYYVRRDILVKEHSSEILKSSTGERFWLFSSVLLCTLLCTERGCVAQSLWGWRRRTSQEKWNPSWEPKRG